MKIICLLVLLTDGCGWKKNEPQRQVKRRPVRRPPPPPTRATPPKRKRRPKKPAKPTKPAPTDFVGEKPRWVEVMQKGPNCVADTTAAVPCKDPLKPGKTCDEKFSWSTYGYIRSEVQCIKTKNGVKRREFREECTEKKGEFQCWKHWSTVNQEAGCDGDYC